MLELLLPTRSRCVITGDVGAEKADASETMDALELVIVSLDVMDVNAS